MTKLKSFRLSEEAINILEQQDNATKFIEDLLLKNPECNTNVIQKAEINEATVKLITKQLIQEELQKYDLKLKPIKGKYCQHGWLWGADNCVEA